MSTWRHLRLARGAGASARPAQFAFEELGTLNLKNIARPLEAFVLRPDPPATAPKSVERSPVGNPTDSLPLPDRPSIAVLAFTNMSGDPEQEYFSDGIADDIITELSRMRWLFVIARNTSFTDKGHAIDVKRVGSELGVRYVLEGSVRRGGERVRVIAQLIDAETGNHAWAERYDRDLADIFAVQDEITRSIVQAIGPAISGAEQQRALRRLPQNLNAWGAYQRALSHWSVSGDVTVAVEFLHRAVALVPHFAPPHAMLGLHYLLEIAFGGRAWAEGLEQAETEVPHRSGAGSRQCHCACSIGLGPDARKRARGGVDSPGSTTWVSALVKSSYLASRRASLWRLWHV